MICVLVRVFGDSCVCVDLSRVCRVCVVCVFRMFLFVFVCVFVFRVWISCSRACDCVFVALLFDDCCVICVVRYSSFVM